jgi:hypothetical protein
VSPRNVPSRSRLHEIIDFFQAHPDYFCWVNTYFPPTCLLSNRQPYPPSFPVD